MNKSIIGNLGAINLFIVILGYPLIVLIGTLAGIKESQVVTIPYRYGYLLFSLIYFSFNIILLRKRKFNINFLIFNLFWIMYLTKVFYNVYILDVNANQFQDNTTAFGFALGVCFLPAFNVQFINSLSLNKFYKYLFPSLLIIGLLSIPFAIISLEDTIRAIGGVGLGTIAYGHYGASLVIISLFRLIKQKFWGKIFSIFGVVIGILIMGLAASKSPFVSLIIVIFFFLLSKLSFKRFMAVGFLVFSTLLLGQLYLSYLAEKGSGFAFRVERFIEVGDEARYRLFNQAIIEFLENPILGNKFVIESGVSKGIYPHNLILESFMVLGVVGGGLFLFLIYKAFRISYSNLKKFNSYSWIPLLFIQYFVFGMMSGGIYNSSLFWVFLVLIIALDNLNSDNVLGIDSVS